MITQHRRLFLCLVIALALVPVVAWSQAAKPLSEKDITSLVELGIDDAVIASQIEKAGLAFEADKKAIERLKGAGVSDAVVKAIQKSAETKSKKGAAGGATRPAITFADVLKLLELGIDENSIIKRLEASPTIFTLGDAQTAELKRAGATDRLLKVMAGQRSAPVAEVNDFAIVFDCSASMAEKTPDGQTKMAVAQKVVSDLIDRIPNDLGLTMVVYGHERQRACDSAAVIRPLSPIDAAGKAQLKNRVRALAPAGNTPIALGLRVAGKELTKNNTFGGMVLVSDGKETCNGDPVAEAAALAKNPKLSFGIHVVGFDVAAEERKSLEEIAMAGGGNYYEAASAAELAKSLAEIAESLKVVAKPAPKVESGRRAIKIASPAIEMPEMGEIYIVPAGTPLAVVSTAKIAVLTKYGEELRIPSSTQKYDVIFTPKGGTPVQMIKEYNLPQRRVVDIRPEDYLGLIKVEGTGAVKDIYAAPTDAPKAVASSYAIQRVKKYGEIMVVPKGEYNVFVDGNLLEEGLTVEAGKLQELQ
jgi:hypothetical protein